jgi:hypothetical protein
MRLLLVLVLVLVLVLPPPPPLLPQRTKLFGEPLLAMCL